MARIGRTNILFHVLLDATSFPKRAPSITVPPGCTVYVRGHNGTALGNSAPVFVANSLEQVSGGIATDVPAKNNQVVNPNTQVGFPCESTDEIWVTGNAGDGVTISILG